MTTDRDTMNPLWPRSWAYREAQTQVKITTTSIELVASVTRSILWHSSFFALRCVCTLSLAAGIKCFNFIIISFIFPNSSSYEFIWDFIARLNRWLAHPMKYVFSFPANDWFIEQLSPIRASSFFQNKFKVFDMRICINASFVAHWRKWK